MKLEEIANVSIGILQSREENIYGKNRYKIFNLKNYEENEEYLEFNTDKKLDEKLTKEGDILFRLVYPNKVIYVEKEQANLLIPSQFCIIRSKTEIVEPIYLKWYLESNQGRNDIKMELRGSSIQKISVASVRKLDIKLIDIEKQKSIKDLIELWDKEKNILEMLIEDKDLLYNNIIEEIVEGGEYFESRIN